MLVQGHALTGRVLDQHPRRGVSSSGTCGLHGEVVKRIPKPLFGSLGGLTLGRRGSEELGRQQRPCNKRMAKKGSACFGHWQPLRSFKYGRDYYSDDVTSPPSIRLFPEVCFRRSWRGLGIGRRGSDVVMPEIRMNLLKSLA